jgi:hypothetical protein
MSESGLRRITFSLDEVEDADILERIGHARNRSHVIRELLKRGMEAEQMMLQIQDLLRFIPQEWMDRWKSQDPVLLPKTNAKTGMAAKSGHSATAPKTQTARRESTLPSRESLLEQIRNFGRK